MKKAVFFDFFGVISCEIAPFWLAKYIKPEELMEVKLSFTNPADKGEISEDEMFARISRTVGVPADDIRREWEEMVKINTPLVDYIRRAKEKYPVYLLSNATEGFLHKILKENSLYSLFDGLFISSEVGLIKPSVEYFTSALDKFGLLPSEVVMIDDNPKNLAGAKEAGIDGIRFCDNESFIREFEGYYGKI